MKTMFLSNIRAEFLKSKRSFAYWLTLGAAVFIPAINFLILTQRPDIMLPKFHADGWITFFRFCWKNVAAVILPMYIILISNLLVQIEYRNNTWKQVYTTPRSFADIFFSKYAVIQVLILTYVLIFDVFVILSGLAVNLANPGYSFVFESIQWYALFTMTCKIYLGAQAVTVIQYWLSLRFRNFVVPLGIGIGLWITGIVLMDWEHIDYYPYIYSTFLFFLDPAKEPDRLQTVIISAAVAFPIALILGFLDITRLKERG
jgi:hypothetical protein